MLPQFVRYGGGFFKETKRENFLRLPRVALQIFVLSSFCKALFVLWQAAFAIIYAARYKTVEFYTLKTLHTCSQTLLFFFN